MMKINSYGNAGHVFRNMLAAAVAAMIAACIVQSCSMRSRVAEDSFPCVTAFMSDTSSAYVQMLDSCVASYRTMDKKWLGHVAIIGEYHGAAALVDTLAHCDMFSNLHGSTGADGLLDFSGERILVFSDSTLALTPESILKLAALASGGESSIAKLMVVVSEGESDRIAEAVDTLFYRYGMPLPVMRADTSMSLTASRLYDMMRKNDLFTRRIAPPQVDVRLVKTME